MNREQVYQDMKNTLGLVPTFFKTIPEATLNLEWNLFKSLNLGETVIPNKYKELIGVGISAATKCTYCTLFHTEIAKMHGATDAEIEDAVHYAKSTAGWSAYLNGLSIDFDQFKDEVFQIVEYVQAQTGSTTASTRQKKGSEETPRHA
jgi:AhpD family alkylhydroperoxidase